MGPEERQVLATGGLWLVRVRGKQEWVTGNHGDFNQGGRARLLAEESDSGFRLTLWCWGNIQAQRTEHPGLLDCVTWRLESWGRPDLGETTEEGGGSGKCR